MTEAGRRICIEISPSEMQAFVTVDPGANKGAITRPITVEEIQASLKAQGITFGIDDIKLREIVDNQKWKQKIQIAQGKAPQKGCNGEIEYYFNTDQKPHPRERDDGFVDYKEIGLINLVEKDDVIARRIPAEPGHPGITVKGERIAADRGEEKYINAGFNTYFADNGDKELRATITGSVALERGGIVKVEDTLVLRNGVNFATGNVDYPGDVIITGDVESGFSVKSQGKIEIRGVVSDAIVEAEGDILIKGGFIGSGKGKITSSNDVFVKFVDNQHLEVKGSVNIGDNCLQATIKAGGRIDVKTGSGTVIGGHLIARDGITLKTAGNIQNTKTVIEISGDTCQYSEMLLHKEGEIHEIKTKISEISSFVAKLKRRNAELEGSDPETVEKIQKYQDLAQNLNQKVEKLEAEFKVWAEKGGCKGDIKVIRKIFPGTVIIMGGISLTIDEAAGKATFKRYAEEIIDFNNQKVPVEQLEPVI